MFIRVRYWQRAKLAQKGFTRELVLITLKSTGYSGSSVVEEAMRSAREGAADYLKFEEYARAQRPWYLQCLGCVRGLAIEVGRRMREIYRPLLWSSAHGSYLGEPGGTDATSDAFATLMASLRARLPAGSSSRWCDTEEGCASSPAPPPTKDPLCDLEATRGPLAKRALG